MQRTASSEAANSFQLSKVQQVTGWRLETGASTREFDRSLCSEPALKADWLELRDRLLRAV